MNTTAKVNNIIQSEYTRLTSATANPTGHARWSALPYHVAVKRIVRYLVG